MPCMSLVVSGNTYSISSYRIIENYAKWQFVRSFEDYLDMDTQAVHGELKRKTLQTVSDAESRGLLCVQEAESVLPLALARLFAKKLLPAGSLVWQVVQTSSNDTIYC